MSSSTWVGSAYGLNFAGLDADRTLFGERRPDAPTVTIGWEASPATACAGLAGNDTADLQFLSGQRVRMDRVARTATYSGARIARDERVHPYLGQVAIVHSRWLGREAIHAGAFETAGAAWAVVGGRASGKSSVIAALAARGYSALADDTVITDGHRVYAGPRCVDLRHRIPGCAQSVTRARRDTRWRVRLAPAPFAAPLGGWIFLRWGERVALSPIPPERLIVMLARRRARTELGSDPGVILELAGRPGWFLTHPKSWDCAESSLSLLLETVTAAIPATL
ncbi:MAG: hypothetical protein ACR2LF_06095 [Jatrophihabitantaceae bacterium]